ncbi:type III pantothenate kinase [Oribacterium sp. WCC10]|uniref:type III pantothenate kinase n=1 Tax=Oribacterium sp. WCC10 TaxID=1855343 RepID=UPI0008F24ED3|nr:type III pantothenate kinase [Oribacterium sp. WCC10]SFG19725.1 type III pantothenate kinase [Oribacterium sp. WCC10]
MKILLIDVGNSNIVIGLFENGVKLFQDRAETRRKWDQLSFMNELKTIFYENSISSNAIDGAIISSVVPDINPILVSAIKRLTGKKPIIANKNNVDIPVRNYDMSLLGMDRMVDMLAAREKYGSPLMIYDLGTCTTMSTLDSEGYFIGGMISPGVQLSLDAEAEKTAQLPELMADAPEKLLGDDTVSCMINGVVIGTAAMIDGIHQRVAEEMGLSADELPLVLTGGLSKLVLPWMKHQAHFEPDLLLNGLEILYKKSNS